MPTRLIFTLIRSGCAVTYTLLHPFPPSSGMRYRHTTEAGGGGGEKSKGSGYWAWEKGRMWGPRIGRNSQGTVRTSNFK